MTRTARSMYGALRPVGLSVVALVLVAGCTGGSGSESAAKAAAEAEKPPVIVITPAKDKAVAPTSKVVIEADKGTLEDVEVKSEDGSVVPGKLYEADRIWRSDEKLLQFGAKYDVEATALHGTTKTTATSTFKVKQTKGLRAMVSPDNRTVGVGMPITVTLSAAPTSRAEVEKRLTVTTSKPVTGSWHWFGDKSLHWRPKDFWPANTDVEVKAKLKGVKFAKNTYGDHNTSAKFKIGDRQVSTVDVSGHQMTVTKNGKFVRTIPVTTGDTGFTTRAGIKVIVTKEKQTVMDSSTVDIPSNSPDAYRLNVKNAMRLTWSGEYLHAAPWSVSQQGRANVSHGCTGMSDANAQWMFDFSQIGDVVKYVNSSRPLEQGNGYTDWNVSWSDWLAGSALV